MYNIRKDLEAGFEEIVCVCLTEKVKNDITRQLKETEPIKNSKIIIMDLKDFIN